MNGKLLRKIATALCLWVVGLGAMSLAIVIASHGPTATTWEHEFVWLFSALTLVVVGSLGAYFGVDRTFDLWK